MKAALSSAVGLIVIVLALYTVASAYKALYNVAWGAVMVKCSK